MAKSPDPYLRDECQTRRLHSKRNWFITYSSYTALSPLILSILENEPIGTNFQLGFRTDRSALNHFTLFHLVRTHFSNTNPTFLAIVLSNNSVIPQAALISLHSTGTLGTRPRRRPLIVPNTPS